MKQILSLIIGLVLLAGCKTLDTEKICANAEKAYVAYLAVMNAQGTPTEDQVKAADAAAFVLAMQCGWTPPVPATVETKGKVNQINFVDFYGVQVLLPPK